MSVVGVDGREFAVEERLKEIGGDEGVELALFAEAGEFFAGPLSRVELLLGFEGAEAFINEKNRDLNLRGELTRR